MQEKAEKGLEDKTLLPPTIADKIQYKSTKPSKLNFNTSAYTFTGSSINLSELEPHGFTNDQKKEMEERQEPFQLILPNKNF